MYVGVKQLVKSWDAADAAEAAMTNPKPVKPAIGFDKWVEENATTSYGRGPSIDYHADYLEVEIINSENGSLGEFDEIDMKNETFIENKSAKGIGTPNPRTGIAEGGDEIDWAIDKIHDKTAARINNFNNNTVATRPTKNGSQQVPSFEEIKDFKNIHFEIDADTPQLRNAVNYEMSVLKSEFPDWNFSATFGK
jgi:hypothetical protein